MGGDQDWGVMVHTHYLNLQHTDCKPIMWETRWLISVMAARRRCPYMPAENMQCIAINCVACYCVCDMFVFAAASATAPQAHAGTYIGRCVALIRTVERHVDAHSHEL